MSTGWTRLTPKAESLAIDPSLSEGPSLLVQREGNGRATSVARHDALKPVRSSFRIFGCGLPTKLG